MPLNKTECKHYLLELGVHFKVNRNYPCSCSQGEDSTVTFESDKVFLNWPSHFFSVIVLPVVLNSMTTGWSRILLLLSTESFVRSDPDNTTPDIQGQRYEIASR